MLILSVLLVGVMCEVSAEVTSTPSMQELLVADLTASTFLDDNGYIRLNISWGDVMGDTENVSISFSSDEECNPITDVENYALYNRYIIRPSMELEHPADSLIHGCSYSITLEDVSGSNQTQSLTYKVPECVENKCQCRSSRDSPNKLSRLRSSAPHKYVLEWDKISDDNVTVHYIYYRRKDIKESTKTYIPDKSLKYNEDGVEIPMHDLKDDVVYTITVVFIDEFNECMYVSSLDYKKSSESRLFIFALATVAVIIILVVFYKISLCSPRLRSKLGKYFFPKSYSSYRSPEATTPLTQFKMREEINAQYTPLEFVLKAHKYDEYEFPRNKIILLEELDEGAFGKVFKSKAYDFGGKPGFTEVAVKQLKDGASEEQIIDFQTEIAMLKKIGRHENVVRFLGCVTMDQPYLMVMELIRGGSLKKYLLKLRKKWSEKKDTRIFFPDDMDEDWLRANNQKVAEKNVKYISCEFDTSESSYIVPITPKSADSSVFLKTEFENYQKLLRNQLEPAKEPHTPTSMYSSRLPSSTETELTNLDLETPTPLTAANHLPEPVLDHKELQEFAHQIASGMQWLEAKSITHRDLAARNVLITSGKVLKISDFGMSRTGLYVNQTQKKVPLRWMAIESIENQKWDNKSDVWSFGVVLWEIGTLGAFPYEHTHDTFVLPELKKGKRLERPKICTDELYSLMLRCWSEKPEERPSFSELVELLDVKKRKVYVDFDQLSPKYVFPPSRGVNDEDEGNKSGNKSEK